MSAPAPSRFSPTEIQALLAECDASSQSPARCAQARGIAVWRLRYALDRRAGQPRPAVVKKPPRTALLPIELVDSAPARSAPSVEVLLAGGHRLQVSADCDPELLRRVVGALARCWDSRPSLTRRRHGAGARAPTRPTGVRWIRELSGRATRGAGAPRDSCAQRGLRALRSRRDPRAQLLAPSRTP